MNLNVFIEPLSQLKGIFPFIVESQFAIYNLDLLTEFDFKLKRPNIQDSSQ